MGTDLEKCFPKKYGPRSANTSSQGSGSTQTTICTIFLAVVPAQSNEHDCRHDYHNDFINFGGWTEMLYCTGQAAPTWSCSRARRNGTPCTTQQQLHPTTATTVHVFISRHAQPTAGRCRLLHLRVLRSNARNRGRVYAKFREAACFPSRDLIVQRPISEAAYCFTNRDLTSKRRLWPQCAHWQLTLTL